MSLYADIVPAAIVHNPSDPSIEGKTETLLNQVRMPEPNVYLIRHQWLLNIPPQKLDLSRAMVAHAEVAYLASTMQLIECLRDLLRLNQHICIVKQENIEIVRAETSQTSFDRLHDMLVATIIKRWRLTASPVIGKTDTALALNHNLMPKTRRLLENLSQCQLCLVTSIDVSEVKKGDAAVVGPVCHPRGSNDLLRRERVTVPIDQECKTESDSRDFQISVWKPIGA
jgi:hypothetical protein